MTKINKLTDETLIGRKFKIGISNDLTQKWDSQWRHEKARFLGMLRYYPMSKSGLEWLEFAPNLGFGVYFGDFR